MQPNTNNRQWDIPQRMQNWKLNLSVWLSSNAINPKLYLNSSCPKIQWLDNEHLCAFVRQAHPSEKMYLPFGVKYRFWKQINHHSNFKFRVSFVFCVYRGHCFENRKQLYGNGIWQILQRQQLYMSGAQFQKSSKREKV